MNTYSYIPDELKALNQWVCWYDDKVPMNPKTGGNAQVDNPKTWGSFKQSLYSCDRYNAKGIGFVFNKDGIYFGVDIDHCSQNKELCNEIVDGLKSYSEYSISGEGIHIICKGKLPNGKKKQGDFEMYSAGRFFICTGNIYNSHYTEIADCTESIKPIHQKYLFSETIIIPASSPYPANYKDYKDYTPIEDTALIMRIQKSKNGRRFNELYIGNWECIYSSQSEADLAFCQMLAFWTRKNPDQMNRIFRTSALYRRKWEEKRGEYTYGEMTINKAINSCHRIYLYS